MTEFEMIDTLSASTAYVVIYKLIPVIVLDRKRQMGVELLPWRWHILSIRFDAGRGIGAGTCGLGDVFPPDDLGSGPYTQFIIIYKPCIIATF